MRLFYLIAGIPPLAAQTGLTPSLRSVVGPFGVALQAKPNCLAIVDFYGSKPLVQALRFCPQKNQFLSKLVLLVAGTGLTRFARWAINRILYNKPDLIVKSISFFVL